MTSLIRVSWLTFLLVTATVVSGRAPTTHQRDRNKSLSHSTSQKLVWEPNPNVERISSYNVYEKTEGEGQSQVWKRIATVHEPSFPLRKLTPGTHVLAVTACSTSGESERSAEMVVTK
jgi:hypothetical protein